MTDGAGKRRSILDHLAGEHRRGDGQGAGGVRLFEGVAEGEQTRFTEGGTDKGQADRQGGVGGEAGGDDQIGPARDVRQNGGASVDRGGAA